jgi:hypothetical protein
MTDELVAYLLDDLCPERRAEVERRLADDPQWQREFERLKECFAATSDPARCVDEPPRDLVKRTCRCVEESGVTNRRGAATPVAFSAGSAVIGGRSPWSLVDFAVAGGVLTVLGMLMLPALRESRDAARRIACQNNLRTLGTAISDYAENHCHWAPPIPENAPAALYAVALADDEGVDRKQLEQLLVCPDSELAARISNGTQVLYIPTREELERAEGARRAQILDALGGIYAYRVGFKDDQGGYHPVKFTGKLGESMLADPPRLVQLGVRSSNHGGEGQNVCDQRIKCGFLPNGDVLASRDSIYLNDNGQHAAGVRRGDIVLIRGDRCPQSLQSTAFIRPISDPGDAP